MKNKWWAQVRSKFKRRDLFKQTHRRLTLQFSGILMLFLGLFTVFVYSLLYMYSIYEQEMQINDLANQEVNEMKDLLLRSKSDQLPGNITNEFTLGQEQFFYYLLNKAGQPIAGDEMIHPLRPDLIELIQGWNPGPTEVRYAKLSIGHPLFRNQRHTREIHLVMTGRALVYNGDKMGTLYVGKDISFQSQLLRWLLMILVSLVLLFALVAIVISHFMSKRSMKPIIQSYRRQQEFVADASHELRTPLSVMLSSIDTLELEEHIEQDPFSFNVLSNMKDEVKRMTKLVGDLLTLARSDSGDIELAKSSFDFSFYAHKIIQTFLPLASSKQIHLQLDVPETLVILGDLDRLTQLVYILLDNAIKYTPENGEVKLRLFIEHVKHRELLYMIVKDTGIGIDSEDHDRIFDRFYREDKARSRQLGGHGLGLAIAKWIVDAHQGRIRVSSKIGTGTTFTIIIPIR
ncbi:MAG TPA: ATP-binding protein [Bacillota bacterium]|nr:ATP-binding protein [Bacillota bacterium]